MMKQSNENEMDVAWNIVKDKLSTGWTNKISHAKITRLDPVPSITLAKYFDLCNMFMKTSKGYHKKNPSVKGEGHDKYSMMGQLSEFIEVSPDPQAIKAAEKLKDQECFMRERVGQSEFSASIVIESSEFKKTSLQKYDNVQIALKEFKYRTLLPVNSNKMLCLDEVKKLNIPILKKYIGQNIYIIDYVLFANVEVNLWTRGSNGEHDRVILESDRQIPVAFSYHKYKVNSKGAISGPTIALGNAKKTNGIFEVAEAFKNKGVKINPLYKRPESI